MRTDPAGRADYGPRVLAKYLDTFCGQIDRAREFGLIPGPDQPDGKRWSAAAAEEIRSRWPEIEAATECIGRPGLAKRGWTGAMIRDLLGKPDTTADGPLYSSATRRRLWRLERVVAAEATPEFTARSTSGR